MRRVTKPILATSEHKTRFEKEYDPYHEESTLTLQQALDQYTEGSHKELRFVCPTHQESYKMKIAHWCRKIKPECCRSSF